MSVAVTYGSEVTVVETLSDASLSTKDKTVTHSTYNISKSLSGGSTPAVTKVSIGPVALDAGAKTVDLTALTGTNGAVVDLTGLKVQILRIEALSDNANTISIEPGSSNGYALAGADFKLTLAAGQHHTFYGANAAPAVGPSAKTLDLAGTGSQGVKLTIVAG